MSHQTLKRFLDVVGSLSGLILSSPLWLFIALAIKLGNHGPVIIKLDRVSASKIVKVYKFRSMVVNAPELKPQLKHLNERTDGPFFKMRHDPRITKVGRIIRKFRLDELPQLINVLKGELALVGPRPHEAEEIKYYPPEYQHLPDAKAGVTGLSQINGASSLSFLKELSLDDYYLKNQSLWLDLKIIVKTIAILLFDPTAV